MFVIMIIYSKITKLECKYFYGKLMHFYHYSFEVLKTYQKEFARWKYTEFNERGKIKNIVLLQDVENRAFEKIEKVQKKYSSFLVSMKKLLKI